MKDPSNLHVKKKIGLFSLKSTVLVTGASVMIVEILGSRLMAPYYGSSTFVWSALIGVILASLSLGYYHGGRMADRNPSFVKLSRIILVSSLLVFIIPFAGEPIIAFTTYIPSKLGLLLAASLLLAAPAYFLGMVSPYAIRLSAEKLDSIGSTAGDLYALSTLGSIVGTMATGFILIPLFNVSTIFYSVGIVLLLSSISLDYQDRKLEKNFMVLVIIGFMLFFPPAYIGTGELVYSEDSSYYRIIVSEEDGKRDLFLDDQLAGSILLDTGYTAYEYINFFELPFFIKPDIKDILMIGAGTLVGPRQILVNHPSSRITISEIDQRVIGVAKDYFFFEQEDNVDINVGDVRLLVKDKNLKYDYIVMDVYNGKYSIPSHLVTREFFSDLAGVMDSSGILLLNLVSHVRGPKSIVTQSIVKTLQTEFKYVDVYHLDEDASNMQNILILVSNEPIPGKKKLSKKLRNTELLDKVYLKSMIRYNVPQLSVDDGIIMSDDYVPIDYLYLSIM